MKPSLRKLGLGAAAVLLAGCSKGGTPPASPGSPLQFRDVAAERGVSFTLGHGGKSPLDILEITGHGLAAIDFDADSDSDLLFLGPDRARLFRNDGGRFADATAGSGLPQKGYWVGAAVGDYDNDGRADLYLSGYHARALLRNLGGRFVDVTAAAGLPAETGWGSSSGFVDLDQDGRLDLISLRYLTFGPGSRRYCEEDGRPVTCAPAIYPAERLSAFRGLPDGRFVDSTRAWGLHQTAGRGLGLVPLDYDNDGWTDLYVANDTEAGDLFRNQGGKHFENVAFRTGTALADDGKALGGMGLDAQDYDDDGWLDLAITTFEAEPKCLWRNEDGARFTDQSQAVGLDVLRPLVGWGVAVEDFDNDGLRDIFYAHGHILRGRVDQGYSYPQPLRLFRQVAGAFQNVSHTLAPALQRPLVGRSVVPLDFDGDGRLDLAVANMEGPALLLRNESAGGGHWLRVRLEGTRSNRMALGARVTVEAGSARRIAEVKTTRSIFAAAHPALHFGLGAQASPVRISVRWPSGRISPSLMTPVDREVRIREPG